ncbi:MAG: ParB/RepB/Spo0J family partition protein [Hyphomicrobiaceae bacterium]|nr:ParB/RepB/Spo0J family partition protein [Hyphomicrobiaceae bacterium]
MTHTLTQIPLDRLHASRINVRRHGPKAIDSLAASIRSIGLLQPLIVRMNSDGFEVVAGERRLKALERIAREAGPGEDAGTDVPCIVIESADDASAIEASLAENVERLPMDELDQYTAFAALIREGRSEETIAEAFGITPAIVRRRLALARLIPDIHRLYRAGEINGETLKLLTLATRERQKAFVALLRDPDAVPPPRWQLKAWLLGGAEIATSAALFDEADYHGDIKGDLFGDERFFCDAEQFWKLQNAAIATLRDDLADKGWPAVHVIEPAERFHAWDYEAVPKAKGGAAYIEVQANGHVEVHKGLLPRCEARKALRNADHDAVADEGGDDGARPERPELSAPLANYIDLVRHGAVRLALARAPKIALRVMLAHVIGGGTLWKVEPERRQAASEAIDAAVSSLPSEAEFNAERETARNLLGLDGEGPLVAPHSGTRTADVLAKLMELSDKDVLRILAVVMAEALACGSALIDSLGERLAVDVGRHWQPDDTFFALVRDREAVHDILAEVIGAKEADSYLTATGTKKKEIIRMALTGDSRAKVDGWLPRYMRIPQAGYTGRALTARERAAA